MRFLPDSITGRTIAVLLLGMVAFHAVSIAAYRISLDSEIDLTNEMRLAERVLSIKRTLARLPTDEREQSAHALSGASVEAHWSASPLTSDSGPMVEATAGLRFRLLELAPELSGGGLIIGLPSPLDHRSAEPHLLKISMRLTDGSWTNVSVSRDKGAFGELPSGVLATTLMGIALLGLSIVMLRWVTWPLRQCAAAAQRLYIDSEPKPIAVSGPREIRDLATAFNALQQRVKRLLDDRTLMLAAISHDLKAPLTRIQLRIEGMHDAALRQDIEGDLGELLVMVEGTLAFLKGEQAGEAVREIDLNSMLESIGDDFIDLGHRIVLAPEGKVVVRGRNLALKRAFTNLIANAVKYGGSALVAFQLGESIDVLIDDEGPGIPINEREAVFQPFYRIEGSRNRSTGGTGLGLTVARTIIRGHGGDVTLHNAPSGGLRVVVSLPPQSRAGG